jgi:anti-sigma B factor antagonist
MDLRISQDDGIVVVVARGALDETALATFNDELHPLIERRGTRLLIDIAAAKRITSNGIASLVALVARATAHASRVVIASPTPFVMSVFQVTRLDTYLEIAADLEDGRRRLGAKAGAPAVAASTAP